MRLALTLLRRKMPHGNIFIGKDRIMPKIKEGHMKNVKNRLQQEEENMFYLRNPYLTLDQSWGHAKELGKHEKWLRNKYLEGQKCKPNVTIEERYKTLRTTDVWD
ncbi:ribosomal protein 63, mitochondrial-like [Penaeus japonicus]|uniref:ribosomal protein 63, mitochondrial-like n=1 Tax=Penaeus japonicus TaxID=27405 RepID=UPI001C70EC45|nr:ribosomal protein 63, mitochondrial-like [Penaeus japonicus]